MKYLASFFRGRLKYRLVITTIVHAQKSLPWLHQDVISHVVSLVAWTMLVFSPRSDHH